MPQAPKQQLTPQEWELIYQLICGDIANGLGLDNPEVMKLATSIRLKAWKGQSESAE